MKRMDRYLLREYLVPLTYCLAAFSMVFVLYDLFDHLSRFMESKTPPLLTALYYLCLLTPTFEFIVPASLLLAALYALWHLARHNELTAMRASGVSFLRVMAPFLGVGLFFTFLSGVLRETVAPRAGLWAEDFRRDGFTRVDHQFRFDRFYVNKAAHRQWKIAKLDLKYPHLLTGVEVRQERPDGSSLRRITADRAEWLDKHWWFYNVKIQSYDLQDNPIGGPEPAIPFREMRDFPETPSDVLNEARNAQHLNAFQLWKRLQQYPDVCTRVDFHTRLAMPWACFVLTLFGIPMGARHARQNALTGVFLAVALLILFYALMRVGVFCAKRSLIEPWLGAWFANIIGLATGIVLVRKTR